MTSKTTSALACLCAGTVWLVPVNAGAVARDEPLQHVQTKGNSGQDGEVLTSLVTTVKGVRAIVMGGNFDSLQLPNGKRVSARNLAAVSLYRPNEVLFTGQTNNYVRALSVDGDRLYIGGDFTTIQGQSREHVAAYDKDDMALLGFNPGSDRSVYGLDAAKGRVVFGGQSRLVKATDTEGRLIWAKTKTTGDVKVVMMHPNGNSAYVGGLFDTFDKRKQHGLVRVNARTGKLYAFSPGFRFDEPLNKYNGDCILSLSWGNDRLIVGSGGGGGGLARNAVWSLNPRTGSWRGSGWGRSHIRIAGDVQAVLAHRGTLYAGYHRNHGKYFTNRGRFTATFDLRRGREVNWDPGFWGNQRNQAGSNNGVSTISVGFGRLVVGGAFLGTGDRSKDVQGNPGQHRQGLAVFRER